MYSQMKWCMRAFALAESADELPLFGRNFSCPSCSNSDCTFVSCGDPLCFSGDLMSAHNHVLVVASQQRGDGMVALHLHASLEVVLFVNVEFYVSRPLPLANERQ